MDAMFHVHLLSTGEVYDITMPDMGIRGILIGTIMTEFAGKSAISCPQTGYSCDFDFKAKPMFGGSANSVEAVVKKGDEPIFKIKGKWDETLVLTTLSDKSTAVFFENSAATHARRLPRNIVPLADQRPYTENVQGFFESEITWKETTEGIKTEDQDRASRHKSYLEEQQRIKAKKLDEEGGKFESRYFDGAGKEWTYKNVDLRPWEASVDAHEYELDGIIKTLTVAELAALRRGSADPTAAGLA